MQHRCHASEQDVTGLLTNLLLCLKLAVNGLFCCIHGAHQLPTSTIGCTAAAVFAVFFNTALSRGVRLLLHLLRRHTAAPVQPCASPGLKHACFRLAQLLPGSPVHAVVLAGCIRRGMELHVH
jgi:hypothetical protein